jgi:diguanylate cyclase (GGDEF)-like protein
MLRRWETLSGLGLLMVALATIPFAHLRFPGLAGLIPALMLLGAVAEACATALIVTLYRRAPLRSLGFLGLAFAAQAAVSVAMTLAFPLGLHGETVLPTGLAAIAWLYPTWACTVALTAFVYSVLESRGDRTPSSPAFLWGCGVAVVFGVGALAMGLRALDLHGDAVQRYGPRAAIILLVLAALAMMAARHGSLTGLRAGLRLGLLAVALDAAINLLSTQTYPLAWYVGCAFYVSTSVLVLVSAVSTMLAWQSRFLRAEADVKRTSQLADRHARRLEMLWRIASTSGLDDARFLHALLNAASAVLHDETPFHGAILHVDGAECVVDVALGPEGREPMLQPGSRRRAAEMLCGHVLRAGRTQSWLDVRADAAVASTHGARADGVRAFVGTLFHVGTTAYVLALASESPLTEPLGPLDLVYVETLASLCATRLHQRAQFDRLRYQTEHDTLTAVLNRSAFRARAATALQAGVPFALALIDIDGFRAVNEKVGQQTGDALLVEVAAALAQRAGDDVVARLEGDTFAILMPNVATRPDAYARLSEYQRGFAEPISTGTFGTVRSVQLAVTCGVALAPADGGHVDSLLLHANWALDDGKARRGNAHRTESGGASPNAVA